MNAKIKAKWDEAESNPGKAVDIGRLVVCDVCDADYTERTESGGFIFGSYAYCPDCTPRHLNEIKRHGETRYIKARCPKDKSFADFVRAYRGRNNFIQINPQPNTMP